MGDDMDFNLISKVELINDEGESTLGTVQDGNEDRIYVSITVDKKKFKLLRPGDLVRGIITDADKVLGFNGIVNQRIHGEMPMYEIVYEELTKIQRREDFRIDCNIPVQFTEKVQDKHSKDSKEGLLIDISGGGVRLLSNEKLCDGAPILLKFKFNEDQLILKGEIVHRGDHDAPNGMRYGYGIQFKDITDVERETIIKNIFLLIRKRIQK